MSVNSASAAQITAVRRFGRFYTRHLGLLLEGYLESQFTLAEARILYELAQAGPHRAADLARELGLDAGYLSRILKRFEARRLIARTPSEQDGRQSHLALTEEGRAAFAPLDRASHDHVDAMLSQLSVDARVTLATAMATIERLLGDAPARPVPFLLRPLQVGDIGWIIRRQGMLYAQEYGWDDSFEGLVAEIAGAFVRTFDPKWESCWIAERDGEIVGSVFVVRDTDRVAKLRLLYVEPSARGLGIGRRLVDEAIRFARAKNYETLTLWTNDILAAARRIYEDAGFRLVEQENHRSFGQDLVGQNWDLALQTFKPAPAA